MDSGNDILRKKNVSDQLFEILEAKIISGEFKCGQRIPSENELAKHFSVSRLSARTAIQKLEALGLVEIRVGDGTYIKGGLLDNLLEESSKLMKTVQDLDDMSEFRYYFEEDYMILACRNRTEEDIETAKEHLRKMIEYAKKSDVENFIKEDALMHYSICMATKNPYFVTVYKLMEHQLTEHYRESIFESVKLPVYSDNKESDLYSLKLIAEGHQTYVDALVQRKPEIASNYIGVYLRLRRTKWLEKEKLI